ncbi:RRP8P like methyltransferase [Cryptosporidium ubiquitum]|uniref:Ribosomal RNA-processing protein 8 n=1 Tax=Cryptosporidium ubiquitum TaxID=857276 RepID=A0A1J4MDY7_9CRYT|nr:RRP8P like methyltransferase [Cryptosporidium ubiquitum]OII72207.1 RRP8P like methyltransferase [Cryptosporidium ubiquitum]
MLSIRGKNRKTTKGTGLSKTGLGTRNIGTKKQDSSKAAIEPNCIQASKYESNKLINNDSINSEIRENNIMNLNSFPVINKNGNNKISNRLQGSLFRKINEFLYTSDSEKAFSEYMKDNNMFENYHKGYEIQKKSWPVDPLDSIINYISKNKHLRIIGDFGCGTGKIGQTFGHIKGYKVYSFDLNCPKEISEKYNITICNMKNIPLSGKVLDLAVFCLSLMGTDWPLFIKEACRTLKDNGILIIAEVSSRIEDSKSFALNLQKQLNLELIQDPINLTNYFTQFIFKKKPFPIYQPSNFPNHLQSPTFKNFSKKNKYYFSNLKYKYGLRLRWIYRISKNFKSLKLANMSNHDLYCGNQFYIDHNLLKPCVYKKR